MPDSYTDWQRHQHDADGGFAAALASGHEKAAAVLRNLPDNLMAVTTTQYVFAATGYYPERQAAVDAWAAAHHVEARWVNGTGYCARLECGPLAVVSTPEDRAAYIAGMRRLMDILEANPDLAVPGPGSAHPFIIGMPYQGVPAALAAWETAIGTPLTAHIRGGLSEPDSDDGSYYDLEGQIEGLRIVIRAWRDDVVERRVTGTRTVETVEWVRLPAEDPAGSADENEEPQA